MKLAVRKNTCFKMAAQAAPAQLTSVCTRFAARSLWPAKLGEGVIEGHRPNFGGMIVLVDTSVWIRFLSNRASYAAGFP